MMPEKQRVANAASTEPLDPDIVVKTSRSVLRERRLRLAHWAASLLEGPPARAQRDFEAFREVCPIPERCVAWRACMWAHQRAMRVAHAREQVRRAQVMRP